MKKVYMIALAVVMTAVVVSTANSISNDVYGSGGDNMSVAKARDCDQTQDKDQTQDQTKDKDQLKDGSCQYVAKDQTKDQTQDRTC